MTRFVLTKPVTLAATDYQHPERRHKAGDVVELSAAEVTAIGGGNLRTVTTLTVHDQLGEAAGVSNGD
jgi:hypothetical protein